MTVPPPGRGSAGGGNNHPGWMPAVGAQRAAPMTSIVSGRQGVPREGVAGSRSAMPPSQSARLGYRQQRGEPCEHDTAATACLLTHRRLPARIHPGRDPRAAPARRPGRLRRRRDRGPGGVHPGRARPLRGGHFLVHQRRRPPRRGQGRAAGVHGGGRRVARHPRRIDHGVRLALLRRARRGMVQPASGGADRDGDRRGSPPPGDQPPARGLDLARRVVRLPVQPPAWSPRAAHRRRGHLRRGDDGRGPPHRLVS